MILESFFWVISIIIVLLAFLYWLFYVPINWTKGIEEISYDYAISNKNKNKKSEIINQIRRVRKICAGKNTIPPPFPNGWYAITESDSVRPSQVINVSCLGEQFVVFRTEKLEVFVMDAYCPHMGANLGIGGTVIGNNIECPFHHWSFSGTDGQCTNIPYSSCIPKKAKTKTWKTKEVNDLIFIWYHSERYEMPWQLPIIKEIHANQLKYHGRNEFIINCHIQDIPENGADVAHFTAVHGSSFIAGNTPKLKWTASLGHHHWNSTWKIGDSESLNHTASMKLQHAIRLFRKFDVCSVDCEILQIGPSYVQLQMKSYFGPIVILQTIVPIEPLVQRVVHRFYGPRTAAPFVKFFIYGESIMFERDISIWNHKLYSSAPCLVKEDRTIKVFRNWYNQFYSTNSKTFAAAYETLQW